jgi:hypothetical protein
VARPTTWLALRRWDLDALADAWRTATPFAHVVVDGALGAPACAALRRAAEREPHRRQWGELYELHASATPPATAELRALVDELGAPATLAAVEAITGRSVRAVEAQSYRYDTGCYLLPHTDHGRGRRVSFALYLAGAGRGGELDLYACRLERGAIADARVGTTIAARAGRLVLFDVGPASLHRVREVTAGRRPSVAGWFLA